MEIIIETELQLRIYKEQAEKFKLAMDSFSPPDDPVIAKAMFDGMKSVYDQIEEEINEYESK